MSRLADTIFAELPFALAETRRTLKLESRVRKLRPLAGAASATRGSHQRSSAVLQGSARITKRQQQQQRSAVAAMALAITIPGATTLGVRSACAQCMYEIVAEISTPADGVVDGADFP